MPYGGYWQCREKVHALGVEGLAWGLGRLCDLALSVCVALESVRLEETYVSRLGASLLPRVLRRTARLGSWHAHGCS